MKTWTVCKRPGASQTFANGLSPWLGSFANCLTRVRPFANGLGFHVILYTYIKLAMVANQSSFQYTVYLYAIYVIGLSLYVRGVFKKFAARP